MIVDDDEDLTNLFQTFLEYDGYKVNAFTDPIDALFSFRKNVYDLVLLDLKMPKMNGMLLYEKLRKIDPDLLFCFITSNNEYMNISRQIISILKILLYTNQFG